MTAYYSSDPSKSSSWTSSSPSTNPSESLEPPTSLLQVQSMSLSGRGQHSCHPNSGHTTGSYLSGETTNSVVRRATKNSHRQCVVLSENKIEKTQTVLSLVWPRECWRDSAFWLASSWNRLILALSSSRTIKIKWEQWRQRSEACVFVHVSEKHSFGSTWKILPDPRN